MEKPFCSKERKERRLGPRIAKSESSSSSTAWTRVPDLVLNIHGTFQDDEPRGQKLETCEYY